MCSISGIIQISDRGFGDPEGAPKPVVERMNAALQHRGPDDHGISEFGFRDSDYEVRGALGNTRLAIIDLSAAGHQPMQDPGSGLSITYNGELYNFRELRQEIGDAFGPWQSNTDTEVVLRAYRRWGADAFARLRGMFALAIWDANKHELVLARDRFGIKPLYYAEVRGQVLEVSRSVVFASEVRALLASGLVQRRLSTVGLQSYLEFGSVQAPLTILDSVRSLLPGHCLTIKTTRKELVVADRAFASVMDEAATTETRRAESQHRGSREAAVGMLKERLTDSVRQHLVSDVPLGVFLSGGMDSSALVALMSQVTNDTPKTFSVVFNEAKFSEAPHSRLVAQKFKTDHQEIHLTESQLLGMLPAALNAMDQPTMDGVNTFVVSKAVKDAGVTVALSGLGGDELFAGYATFRRAVRLQEMSSVTRGLLRSAATFGKTLDGSVRRNKFWQLAQSNGSPAAVYEITRQLFSRNQIAALAAPCSNNGKVKARARTNGSVDAVNAVSRLELSGYMTNTLLRDTDFMSMAHSLEVRVPFLDSEVAPFVLGLPGAWKINGSRPKPLLADVVSELLPQEFLERSKMGFTLPFEKWVKSGLRDEISDVFRNQSRLMQCGLTSAAADRVWNAFQKSPGSVGWSRPWSLYVLAKWCEINGVKSEE